MPAGTHISQSILPDHLIYNLSAKDTSPSPKMFMAAIKLFIDHFTLASITLHTHLLFLFHLFAHRGRGVRVVNQ